jgi:hypothetical protein
MEKTNNTNSKMHSYRISPTLLILLSLTCAILLSSGAEPSLFITEAQRQGFMRALTKRDRDYDPAECMIKRKFSSPGYHTTLKDGMVHPTRDSLQYAIACLDAGDERRLRRAEDILLKVTALQDKDPKNRTYGIWSWFLEEPLSKMSPPDWNWADFCGALLLQAALDHADRLAPQVRKEVKDSIIRACHSIKRRNVGPGYTNIALMSTYVSLVAGELFEMDELVDYGKARLRRFHEYSVSQGSFSEYNSPTYNVVAIEEISRMLLHVKDKESLELLRKLKHFAWKHVALRFHPPSGQWAGPQSRSYSSFIRRGTLAFLQSSINNRTRLVPDEVLYENLNFHRIRSECPDDLIHYFLALPEPRYEIEVFQRRKRPDPDIVGSTWLAPDYTIASLNYGELWNQRRPLLGYFVTEQGVAAFRARFLHDHYDYSSASIFTAQDKGDILGAVAFATDRGDTHISLDRLKDGKIEAQDLRLRFQVEGAFSRIKPPTELRLNQELSFPLGVSCVSLRILSAAFDGHPAPIVFGGNDTGQWVDVIMFSGAKRQIDFNTLSKSVVFFAISVASHQDKSIPTAIRDISLQSNNDLLTATWQRPGKQNLSITVPVKPLRSRAQQQLFRSVGGGR